MDRDEAEFRIAGRAPHPPRFLEASTSTKNGALGSGRVRMGAVMKDPFSRAKAEAASGVPLEGLQLSEIRVVVIRLLPLRNWR